MVYFGLLELRWNGVWASIMLLNVSVSACCRQRLLERERCLTCEATCGLSIIQLAHITWFVRSLYVVLSCFATHGTFRMKPIQHTRRFSRFL